VGSSGIRTVTVEERPDLLDPAWAATDDLFPEYNSHGEVLERYWAASWTSGRRSSSTSSTATRSWRGRARCRWAGTARSTTSRPGSTARSRAASSLLFDPWLRVHERLGGTILRPEPHSMTITGTVAEWEGWTGMTFPESGGYWFPAGLAPLAVDRDADRGSYREPNVWMLHAVER
jgi:hypothetical protein